MAKGIFVITGPTATGKTALGVRAAKALDGEVISADAMQLYRGMVIGTAAPTPEETANEIWMIEREGEAKNAQ